MAHCDLFTLNGTGNMTLTEAEQRVWDLENSEAMYKLPGIIILGLILLLGFLGNLLVFVVYRLKFSPSTSKYFIMSLALFDMLTSLIALHGELIDLRFDYHFNFPILCKIMRFTITCSTCTSVTLLIAIAVDRYKKICRAFDPQMTLKETKIWIIVSVITGVCLGLPAFVLYGSRANFIAGVPTYDCSFDQIYRWTIYPKVYVGITGVLCLVSFTVLIVLYILIVARVCKQRQKRKQMLSAQPKPGPAQSNTGNTLFYGVSDTPGGGSSLDQRNKTADTKDKSKSQQKQTVKTTIMLLLVTVVFIISFIPHFFLQLFPWGPANYIIDMHCNPGSLVAYKLFLRSYFINCASNPIIYGFFNEKFRTECKGFLRKVFCCSSKQ